MNFKFSKSDGYAVALLSISILLLSIVLIFIVEPQIYVNSIISNNNLSIVTKGLNSHLDLTIKPVDLSSIGANYNFDFNSVRMINSDVPEILIYPGNGLSSISNVECNSITSNSQESKCNWRFGGSGNGIGSPIIIENPTNYDSVHLSYACSTCNYSSILIDLVNANFYDTIINFDLQGNIIDGVESSRVNSYIPKLTDRTADKISFLLDNDSIKNSLIPIFLIVRNRLLQGIETLQLSLIGAFIGSLVLFLIKKLTKSKID